MAKQKWYYEGVVVQYDGTNIEKFLQDNEHLVGAPPPTKEQEDAYQKAKAMKAIKAPAAHVVHSLAEWADKVGELRESAEQASSLEELRQVVVAICSLQQDEKEKA